ncbi:MAG: hypothetical protein JRJ27_15745 [Deltaproteobacteria bacterium]|nr:hypothetical protein [Deltaproteobacteria bacterium]
MKYIHAIKITFFIGFIFIIILLWMNELFDLPYRLLGAPPTPINYKEAVFESVFIVCTLVLFMFISFRLGKHIKYLEGLTVICANCKKIRIQNEWIPIEKWLSGKTDVLFSHGVCNECIKELYPKEYYSLVKKRKITEK